MSFARLIKGSLLAALFVPLLAFAADILSKPAAGSPEEAVLESLKLMRDGKADEWMSKWCQPGHCDTEGQKEDLRAHMLKQAMMSSKNCLYKDAAGLDGIKIKRVSGDPAKDTAIKLYVECTHTQYPPPAALIKVDGAWKVTSIPW